jgi:hypothetical protein
VRSLQQLPRTWRTSFWRRSRWPTTCASCVSKQQRLLAARVTSWQTAEFKLVEPGTRFRPCAVLASVARYRISPQRLVIDCSEFRETGAYRRAQRQILAESKEQEESGLDYRLLLKAVLAVSSERLRSLRLVSNWLAWLQEPSGWVKAARPVSRT